MEIAKIIEKLKEIEDSYKSKGYTVTAQYHTSGHALKIRQKELKVTLRDQYSLTGGLIKITSFDVLFSIDNDTYLDYVSDYPSDEYIRQLKNTVLLIDSFFERKFSVTSERYLLFFKKNCLNIIADGVQYHFICTHNLRDGLSSRRARS